MTERIATVTKDFPGVEQGKVYPRTIRVGETISGHLAEEAVQAGFAKWSGGEVEKTSITLDLPVMPVPETAVTADASEGDALVADAAPEKRRPGRTPKQQVEG